jgi:hypothetical protein
MLWFLIFLIIILAALSYLIFAPLCLEINSIEGLYRIRFHRLASARLVANKGSFKIDLKIAWWHREIDPFAARMQSKKREQSKKSAPAKRKRPNIDFNVVMAVIKSFRVKKCFVTLDTGSMPLNGLLYPAFYLLSVRTGRTVEINFLDRNEIVLEIENSLARIIKVFIFHSFTNKKTKKWTT